MPRRASTSPALPSGSGCRWRAPSAARMRSPIRARSGRAILAMAPIPSWSSGSRQADLVLAVGARLGEATTDGYTLVTPDHPGQTLVHVHPDPERTRPGLSHRSRDLRRHGRIRRGRAPVGRSTSCPFDAGEEAHREWLEWNTPKPGDCAARSGPVRRGDARGAPDDAIICNGAGNFSGWWHRYWHYGGFPSQLAPTSGAMGYGLPAAVAAALRHRNDRGGAGRRRRFPDERAGTGDRGAIWLRPAGAADRQSALTARSACTRNANFRRGSSGTGLDNPDFAALARAYGGWAAQVETTAEFTVALDAASQRKGLRLLHLVIDVEQLSAGGATISGLRAQRP